MAIEDQIVSRDPDKSGWAIRLDLRSPCGKVSISKWMPVSPLWIGDAILRAGLRVEHYPVMERQAIADAGAQAKPREVSDE